MMPTLYQFPISHYCEKVRWALDHKGVSYTLSNLLPGLHVPVIRVHCRATTVPVLRVEGNYLQGSRRIIDWLEAHHSEPRLNGDTPEQQNEIEYWESFLDKEAGVPFRAVAYYHFFNESPKSVKDMWCEGSALPGRIFINVGFPILKKILRKKYGLVPEKVKEADTQFKKALDLLDKHLVGRKFMVGDRLTRADISLGAMLVHMVQPPEFDFTYPPLPLSLQNLMAEVAERPTIHLVRQLYKDHRLSSIRRG